MKQIRRIDPLQAAKVAAVIYFLISFIIVIPLMILFSIFGELAFPMFPFASSGIFLIIPFFYAIVTFLFTALGCLVYNMVAGWVGGIAIEVEDGEKLTDYQN